MKYIININENDEPNAVRFWATVEGLDGCFLAENTVEELFNTAPAVIRTFIEVGNESEKKIPSATEFEFRHLINA